MLLKAHVAFDALQVISLKLEIPLNTGVLLNDDLKISSERFIRI